MQMREREAQINQEVKMREHYKHEQEWQKGREKRVGDWRNFTGDPVKKRRVRRCAVLRWCCVATASRACCALPHCSWGWIVDPRTRGRLRTRSLARST